MPIARKKPLCQQEEAMNATARLKDLVAELRSGHGCSWDRAQTHVSLKSVCVEEAVELLSGIDMFTKTQNADNLQEELGDMLFLIMLHSVIAEEEGLFTFEDVVNTICDKMIRRHPHVFLDVTYESDEEMEKDRERIKREEKPNREAEKGYLKQALLQAREILEAISQRKGL